MGIRKVAALLFCLIVLSGCTLLQDLNSPPGQRLRLMVTIDPESGHPPFDVTIRARIIDGSKETNPEGSYTYSLYVDGEPYDTITTAKDTRGETIHVNPLRWECRVSWTDGVNELGPVAVTAGLENEAPVIHPPRTKPAQTTGLFPLPDGCLGYLEPKQAYLFDFTYLKEEPLYPGYGTQEWGIYDEDPSVIVAWVCWAEEKGPDTPASVFTYPYFPGVFRVEDRHGALVIPWWTGAPDDKGRPIAPYPLPWPGNGGYFTPGCFDWDTCDGIAEQEWYLKITAEDLFGARSTRTFVYRLSPVAADSSHLDSDNEE